jgi:hypothetical protein
LKILAFGNDEDGKGRRRRPQSSRSDGTHDPASPARAKPVSSGVGNALREAYQEALREDVPPEMLDLLGKLG